MDKIGFGIFEEKVFLNSQTVSVIFTQVFSSCQTRIYAKKTDSNSQSFLELSDYPYILTILLCKKPFVQEAFTNRC